MNNHYKINTNKTMYLYSLFINKYSIFITNFHKAVIIEREQWNSITKANRICKLYSINKVESRYHFYHAVQNIV